MAEVVICSAGAFESGSRRVDNIFFLSRGQGLLCGTSSHAFNKPLRGHEWVRPDCILRPRHLGPEDQLTQYLAWTTRLFIQQSKHKKREMHESGYLDLNIREYPMKKYPSNSGISGSVSPQSPPHCLGFLLHYEYGFVEIEADSHAAVDAST